MNQHLLHPNILSSLHIGPESFHGGGLTFKSLQNPIKVKMAMYGPVKKDPAFKGLNFIHPELFKTLEWPGPGFAAFMSSIIESGVPPSEIEGVRSHLREIGLSPYECLNPHLMEYLSTLTAKKNGVLKQA